jgi:hypothetical protein
VLREARNEHEAHRRSIGWQLQFAAPEMLEQGDVRRALRELRDDPAEYVRSGVLAQLAPTDTEAPMADVDGPWLTERVLRQSVESRIAVANRMRARADASLSLEPQAWPGSMALAVARKLSGAAGRHPTLAKLLRRSIRFARRAG